MAKMYHRVLAQLITRSYKIEGLREQPEEYRREREKIQEKVNRMFETYPEIKDKISENCLPSYFMQYVREI